MSEHELYILGCIILNLAFIGAITVIVIAVKIIKRIFKNIKKLSNNSNKTQQIPQVIQRKEIEREYYNSTYYLATKNEYNYLLNNKGLYGEYKIFKMLQSFEEHGARFLFNCYLPREYCETTEIDVILLYKDGIFVFESKNYNGWIYGNGHQELWTQTLLAGKNIHKTHFYNPVRQNQTHIRYLRQIIGNNLPIYSVVVFSDDCMLKDVKNFDSVTKVIYLNQVKNTVLKLSSIRPNSIKQEVLISIYDKLYPYTQVSENIKMQHIENINNKIEV